MLFHPEAVCIDRSDNVGPKAYTRRSIGAATTSRPKAPDMRLAGEISRARSAEAASGSGRPQGTVGAGVVRNKPPSPEFLNVNKLEGGLDENAPICPRLWACSHFGQRVACRGRSCHADCHARPDDSRSRFHPGPGPQLARWPRSTGPQAHGSLPGLTGRVAPRPPRTARMAPLRLAALGLATPRLHPGRTGMGMPIALAATLPVSGDPLLAHRSSFY